ncbi:SIS domain-containing protein [Helcococcus kunzii]|uniref:SIS domain-containing protein n=1 Tax=Helcococcus kunzii TaxID=40091 RepID=UPI001BAEFA7C|nr:SIS domain-containing protein [Helcococcus kunzii]QUY64046.1 SIS domain-containing protein [Helcococcus kunzii]
MFIYQEKILENLNRIIEYENENIAKAKEVIINAIKNRNSIFSFGASHAGIITQELFFRAGGLVVINPIFSSDTMVNESPISKTSKMERLEGYGKIIFDSANLKSGDVLLLHSVSGRNPIIIDFAKAAKEKGVIVIAITNVSYSKQVSSRHSSGQKLYECADIVIDNHGVKGDAIVKVGDRTVGPSSTVSGAFIINTIVTEIAIEMSKENDELIPVFYSANIDGMDEKNKAIVEHYKDIIHYEF